jgi:hypothetical protein
MKTGTGTMAACLLLMAAPRLCADIVQNGGFETGDFSNWTVTGDTANMLVGTFAPHSGTYAAELGPMTVSSLKQTLATEAGQGYNVVYWLYNLGSTPNQFSTYWDGTQIAATVLNDDPGFPYTAVRVNNLMASGTSTVLEFKMQNLSAAWFLDDVVVNPTPEPGSLGLVAALAAAALFAVKQAGRRLKSDG